MKVKIRCAACREDKRAVSLWKQIVALNPDTVCCWPEGALTQPATDEEIAAERAKARKIYGFNLTDEERAARARARREKA